MDAFDWAYFIFAIISIIALVALLFLLFRWKVSFEGKEYSLVPSDVYNTNLAALKDLDRHVTDSSSRQHSDTVNLAEGLNATIRESLNAVVEGQQAVTRQLVSSDAELKEQQGVMFNALQAVLKTVRDLREETQILRNEIETQAKELERHRAGYDVDILRASLVPVARMHRMLVSDLAESHLAEDARSILVALEDEHLGVLETRGVKLVCPEVGARYRDQKNIKHPPDTEQTPDADLAGTIKSVESPAYVLSTSAREVVLLEAQVVVYSMADNTRKDAMNDQISESESDQNG